MDIELGKRTVEGYEKAGEAIIVSAGRSGGLETNPHDLMYVSVELSGHPDRDWLELWKEQDYPNDLEEPRIERGRLEFDTPPDDLERTWDAIKRRVAATNDRYSAEIVPARQDARARQQETAEARAQAIDEAQRRLDELE